ncbi:MAG: zinc ribbon domain-containing protein [Trueperaceae bacterium]|nr:zinc ribbon domain-containing protein [Trueperaceae bacterium]
MTWIVWGLLGGLIAYLAARKGRRAWVWFLYGVAIWPVALLHVWWIDPTPDAVRARLVASGGWRACPHCRELVRDDATACPHCGRDVGLLDVEPRDGGPPPTLPPT